jgi:uncharacterized protein (UPF0303 family)
LCERLRARSSAIDYAFYESRCPVSDIDAALVTTLAEQEALLVFTRFDNDLSWDFGQHLVAAGRAAEHPIAVSIRRNGQRLFHAALTGSAAENDAWLERKSAVVDRYGYSSLHVGAMFRANGEDFDTHGRLDLARYAAHGGAFPITVRDVGVVGTVAVSGLPEVEDHRFVVTELEVFLRRVGHIAG